MESPLCLLPMIAKPGAIHLTKLFYPLNLEKMEIYKKDLVGYEWNLNGMIRIYKRI